MPEFHRVCKVGDVPEGEGVAVQAGGKVIALFCVNGQHHAIDDMCPHMGASLAGGHLENNVVTCPWHAWRFRVTDGTWADNPRVKIGCYPVKVEGDDVLVGVEPKAKKEG
jgi:nitrite reductase (NADH) small subunit/3-phenylpropionate/trans-cinnamate dioxygenase ferredoxin subunit